MNSTIHPVNAVIFDLGGVLINLAPDRTRQAFIDLGIPHFDQLFTVFKATPLFDKLETGHTEIEEFITSLRKESGTTLSNTEIVGAWNAMLLDFRIESLNFIHELKKKMPVFLFSNTNRIHYESFSQTFKKESAYPDLDDFFTKAYYSHDIGFRKPHPEGFQYILEEQQLNPVTTLFVDDNADNIKGATSVGLQTHLLLPEESIESVFDYLLK
ncbi:HAD family phosphatase [Pollutibacter soli]|uniref:HAD family hydrolase n=1 Tax=Pollutibacter soli TaxID=3034157 RepID=UPI0030139DAB